MRPSAECFVRPAAGSRLVDATPAEVQPTAGAYRRAPRVQPNRRHDPVAVGTVKPDYWYLLEVDDEGGYRVLSAAGPRRFQRVGNRERELVDDGEAV